MTDPDKNNIINFDEAKRSHWRRLTLKRTGHPTKIKLGRQAMRTKIFAAIQVLLFLAVIAYMMRLCGA